MRDGLRRLAFGEPGYRDALCARIDVEVAGAAEADGAIELRFADGASIVLRLEADDQSGPEALNYFADDGAWWVL